MRKPTTLLGWGVRHPVTKGGQPERTPVELLNHYKTMTHCADHADIVKMADFALTHGRVFFIDDPEPVKDYERASLYLMLELSEEEAAEMRATLDPDYYDFDVINTLGETADA